MNTTEVALARSSVQGRPIGFVTDRRYLGHALRLGFRQIHVVNAEQPVVCRDERRQYLWQVLGKDSLLKSSVHSIRLSSVDETVAAAPAPVPLPAAAPIRESGSAASKTPLAKDESPAPAAPLGGVTSNGTDRVGIAAVLAEAETIKELLHQAFSRMHQLVASVKRYRRQAQAVRSALGSLRHLQEVAD